MAQIDTDLNSRIDQHKDRLYFHGTHVTINHLWRNSDEPGK